MISIWGAGGGRCIIIQAAWSAGRGGGVRHADKRSSTRAETPAVVARRGPYRKRLTVTPCKLPNVTFLTGHPRGTLRRSISMQSSPAGDADPVSPLAILLLHFCLLYGCV
ncbi:unnamed protein product, partial [Iphiclides podalirius]